MANFCAQILPPWKLFFPPFCPPKILMLAPPLLNLCVNGMGSCSIGIFIWFQTGTIIVGSKYPFVGRINLAIGSNLERRYTNPNYYSIHFYLFIVPSVSPFRSAGTGTSSSSTALPFNISLESTLISLFCCKNKKKCVKSLKQSSHDTLKPTVLITGMSTCWYIQHIQTNIYIRHAILFEKLGSLNIKAIK